MTRAWPAVAAVAIVTVGLILGVEAYGAHRRKVQEERAFRVQVLSDLRANLDRECREEADRLGRMEREFRERHDRMDWRTMEMLSDARTRVIMCPLDTAERVARVAAFAEVSP